MADATGARVSADSDTLNSQSITHVSTDSRDEALSNASLYVALRGERFDGHAFIKDVYAKGVRSFIVEEGADVPADGGDAFFFFVPNTLFALGDVARAYRTMFACPVIGVTGSCGKTTTKELIAAFLATKYTVLKNDGNFNNEVGVPKTLFRLDDTHTIAVIEMGMNHKGELARISRMAEPETAVVTNVEPVHLAFFNHIGEIADAKAEIFSALRGEKHAIVNGENTHAEHLATEAERYGASRITAYTTDEIEVVDEKTFRYKGETFTHMLIGAFNLQNIMAALTVAEAYDVSLAACRDALANVAPVKNRMTRSKAGNATLINDTYNSNPVALRHMLTYLSQQDAKRRIAVIGDMLELGTEEKELHREVGRHIATLPIDAVYTFGAIAKEVLHGLREAGDTSKDARHFTTHGALIKTLSDTLCGESVVLLKGSRGVALDKVYYAVKELAEVD